VIIVWILIAIIMVFCLVIFMALLLVQNTNLHGSLTVNNVLVHLQEFQYISSLNNNSRAMEFGYNDSAAYVMDMMMNTSSFNVFPQYFNAFYWTQLGTPSISMNAPFTYNFIYQSDFEIMRFSPTTNVNGTFGYVAFGCNASDYTNNNFTASIALIDRGGPCSFSDKNLLAMTMGVKAILFLNTNDNLIKTRIAFNSTIPGFLVIKSLGDVIKYINGGTVTINAFGETSSTTTMNIIADSINGDPNKVIVIGAHLDSVPEGPGLNDNGSGSAFILALALAVDQISFANNIKMRFAWWAAEELGLLGSRFYVEDLYNNNPTEFNKIVLNLNFDMIGSPNFIRGIYNASSGQSNIRAGSQIIQGLFETYFQNNNINYTLTAFNGRSDYGPFIERGIPAGGLATGAEEIKTMATRDTFGGVCNTQLDPCYHQPCDSYDNVNVGVLNDMSSSAAIVVERLALDTALIETIYSSVPRQKM